MATTSKYPYSMDYTIIAKGVTYVATVTIRDSMGTVIDTKEFAVSQNAPATQLLAAMLGYLRKRVLEDMTSSDIPLTGTFTMRPEDLL